MTKIINIFGPPCAGKSTVSSSLFSKMKFAKINCEFVPEYVKSVVWEGRNNLYQDQLYITSKQNRMLNCLQNKVTHIVTDSPIILGLLYTPLNYYPSFKQLVKEIHFGYNNINFLLKRVKPYTQIGRNQTEEESNKINTNLINLLDEFAIDYTIIDGDENAADTIFKYVIADKYFDDCCKMCGRLLDIEHDIVDTCKFCREGAE